MHSATPTQDDLSVLCKKDGEVAVLILNRPQRLNAINRDMIAGLLEGLTRALDDPQVKAIIITGAGNRAFCSGDDLADSPADLSPTEIERQVARLQDISRLIMYGKKPVIAAVNGWAVGGGFEWVANCDLIVWDETARGFCPEASLGLSVTGGITVLLPAMIGAGNAEAMLKHGVKADAAQLADWGFADHIAPKDGALDLAKSLASEIIASGAHPRKRALALANKAVLEEALEVEARCLVEAFQQPGLKEKLAALGHGQ